MNPGINQRRKSQLGKILDLSSGAYFFKQLELRKAARLSLDVPVGPIDVHVVDKLVFDMETSVEITPAGGAPAPQRPGSRHDRI